MLAMVLKKRRILCDTAEDGFQATQMTKKSKYHIIFMDDMMPNRVRNILSKDILILNKLFVQNGIEATKIIRENGYKHLIIGLTGNTSTVDIKIFEDAGAGECNFILNAIYWF